MRRLLIVAILAAVAAAPVPLFRDTALRSRGTSFGPTRPHEPFAVIMDIAGPKRVMTVLATSSGGAAFYRARYTGPPEGATIVPGDHESLREAAGAMIKEAAKQMTQLTPMKNYDYPPKGSVTFFIRTPEATLIATVPESELSGHQHPLSPLYEAGQNLISELGRFPMSR